MLLLAMKIELLVTMVMAVLLQKTLGQGTLTKVVYFSCHSCRYSYLRKDVPGRSLIVRNIRCVYSVVSGP